MAFVSDPLVHEVIGCAIDVHRALGPGLLESTYSRCFQAELTAKRIAFKTEVQVSIHYRGLRLDGGYRIDLLVEGRLILEVKAVEALQPIHSAQVLTYLRLSGAKQGLIINFNCPRLKDGLKSVILRESPHPTDPSSPASPSTELKPKE
jgi:GxxExxY protein